MPTTTSIWVEREDRPELDGIDVYAFITKDEYGFLNYEDFACDLELDGKEMDRALEQLRWKWRALMGQL